MNRIFSVTLLLFTLLIISSFISYSSYAQIIGQADVLLSDIYLEPTNPQAGDPVSIQSIIYNAGLDSTKSVTNVVTIGYFINGDLVRIAELPNIEPGVENGILLSSGPIWTAADGDHTVTVILNYHDTLSHLTDNSANNIVQKIFSIGEPKLSTVFFEIFQEYIPQTKMQQITINGNLESSSNTSFLPDQVYLQIGNLHNDIIQVDQNGLFSFSKTIRSFDKITPVTITVQENYPLLGSSYTANIYPIELENNSILSFQIQNSSDSYNFQDFSAVIVIYDESYNVIKKINTAENLLQSEKYYDDDAIFTILPSGTYIAEIYFDGRFFHAMQITLKENMIHTDTILIPESSQIKFQVLDNDGKPVYGTTVYGEKFTVITNNDNNGFTDWVDILPINDNSDPYVVSAILSNGHIISSEPFFVEYGERKVIQIIDDDGNEK